MISTTRCISYGLGRNRTPAGNSSGSTTRFPETITTEIQGHWSAHTMRQFQAVHPARHADIRHENVNYVRSQFTDLQSSRRVFGFNGHETLITQKLDGDRARERLVFGNDGNYRPTRGFKRFAHREERQLSSRFLRSDEA